MFQLIPYLKGYKKESVIGPLFKLLEACFELIVPLVMAKIIDVGIEICFAISARCPTRRLIKLEVQRL